MTFAEIWEELENTDAPVDKARVRRRVHGDRPADLFLELQLIDRHRSLALKVVPSALAGLDSLPQARGLKHEFRDDEDGSVFIVLELVDPAAEDVFTSLCVDVAAETSHHEDQADAVSAWVSRISRWQYLLKKAPNGLSAVLQRALYAELWVLREMLVPAVGAQRAIQGWMGPDRSSHDFQLETGSIEVKSSASNEPQVVRISSERQLDAVNTPSLHLVHVSLDSHQGGHESLIEMIDSVKGLAAEVGMIPAFEESLTKAGYLESHRPRYEEPGYEIRKCRCFQIADGFPEFPRIVESDLPQGIGSVSYDLVVAACAPFEVDQATVIELIGLPH